MIFKLRYCRSPGVDSRWSVERNLRATFTIMPVHFRMLKTTQIKLPERQCQVQTPDSEGLQFSGLPLNKFCIGFVPLGNSDRGSKRSKRSVAKQKMDEARC